MDRHAIAIRQSAQQGSNVSLASAHLEGLRRQRATCRRWRQNACVSGKRQPDVREGNAGRAWRLRVAFAS